MNREPDTPTRRDPDTGPVEECDRLAEIERRLKAARPRPPSLDPVALLQMATGGEVEPASGGRADETKRVRFGRRALGYRGWTALAGSWICGVAVGVLVTLMLVNRPAMVPVPADSIVRQDVRVSEPAEEPKLVVEKPVPEADEDIELDHAPVAPVSLPKKGTGTTTNSGLAHGQVQPVVEPVPFFSSHPVLPSERRMRDDALLAMIADPHDGWHSAAWTDGRVLRAGMLYRRGAEVSRDTPQEAWDMEEPNIDKAERGGRDVNRTIDFEPPAAITRGQLMEELLREASGHGVL